MPIYEFRCLNCNDFFELLFVSSDDSKEMKCPTCGAEELEKVMSASSFTIASRVASAPKTTATQKTCGSGSCTTIEIPGRGD
ncbi:MAG: zinc ribbon domain-containing protein [Pseudomonadota bacterium]